MGARKFAEKREALAFAALALAALLFLLFRSAAGRKGEYADIYVGGDLAQSIRLKGGESASFSPNGAPSVTVTADGGAIAIASSDCPDQLCVLTGYVSYEGEQSVCLPNRVAIRIRANRGGVDAVIK
ncbi:MAG: NusG domain II-containing protein [Eubacteriaceae bacterium]|jgi:hypothetical protein|nr:NusG domain II-containing protein [Eubacteriaceae bacterium]